MAERTEGNDRAGQTATLRRWPHPIFTIVALALVVCVGAAGLWIGYALRSSTDQRIAAAAKPVTTTATVKYEQRQLAPVTGTVNAVRSFSYVPDATQFSGPLVVTRHGAKDGSKLVPGKLLAAIDDVPVFGLRLKIQLWRNLSIGQSGSDVASLNAALAAAGYFHGAATDSYNSLTAAAVAQMYRDAGFVAPRTAADASGTSVNSAATPKKATKVPGDYLPLADIADVPASGLTIAYQAHLGTAAAGGKPVLKAVGTVNSVTATIDVLHKQYVKKGTTVMLQPAVGGDPVKGTITAIGKFTAGKSDTPGEATLSGYPATIALSDNTHKAGSTKAAELQGGDKVQVSFPALSERKLAVPTIAIRQHHGSPAVLVGSGRHRRYLKVTPLWQQNGWTAVRDNSALKSGSVVVVHGR